MSKISRYILKEHVVPFVGSLSVIMFVLLLKFVSQFVGRIFAKGLDIWTILELLYLNLAWMLALAVPMSVLVATLIAFGRMSGDNEITAIRSAGISLIKIIRPVFIAAVLLTVFMFYFNDQILPEYNHKARILMKNISRKKPTLEITEGVFNQFKNFDILTDHVENMTTEIVKTDDSLMKKYDIPVPKLDKLENVIIVDRSSTKFQRTIIAKYGYLYFNKHIAKLVFILFDGNIHESDIVTFEEYRKINFVENVFYLDGSEFILSREEFKSRGDREKTIKMLSEDVERIEKKIEIEQKKNEQQFKTFLMKIRGSLISYMNNPIIKEGKIDSSGRDTVEIKQKVENAKKVIRREVENNLERVKIIKSNIKNYQKLISGYQVEIYKKLSIAFAAVVFVLVGAPLGIRSRKGSVGWSFVISFVFFAVYWVFLIAGEDLADRGIVHPLLAMWAANIVIGGFGIYLTWKTIKEVKSVNYLAMIMSKFKRGR